jgi:RNA polymerase-binding transcription factor DksA
MRRHFHRCSQLRLIALDASDLNRARKGGSQILEELCEAKRLAPCVGLAECDVLTAAQKRDLLAARATQLREEEGGSSPLTDERDERALALEELARDLLEERNEIALENRRRAAEAGGALRRNPDPVGRIAEGELARAGASIVQDDELRALRAARLDVLDRALDAIASRTSYGACIRCRAPIDLEVLRIAPDAVLCGSCEAEVTKEPSPRGARAPRNPR